MAGTDDFSTGEEWWLPFDVRPVAPCAGLKSGVGERSRDRVPDGKPDNRRVERPLSKGAIEKSCRISRCAGIEDVPPDLRHTVGTYAGQSSANTFLVRDLLRHTDLSVTGRYVNRANDSLRALSDHVGERIAAGLAGQRAVEILPLKRGPRSTPGGDQ
jgi:integrase